MFSIFLLLRQSFCIGRQKILGLVLLLVYMGVMLEIWEINDDGYIFIIYSYFWGFFQFKVFYDGYLCCFTSFETFTIKYFNQSIKSMFGNQPEMNPLMY